MSPDPGLTSAAIIALLVLSAFAAAVRAALWNASRTRLGELQKRGIHGAATALTLLTDEDRTMGALALANSPHLSDRLTVLLHGCPLDEFAERALRERFGARVHW